MTAMIVNTFETTLERGQIAYHPLQKVQVTEFSITELSVQEVKETLQLHIADEIRSWKHRTGAIVDVDVHVTNRGEPQLFKKNEEDVYVGIYSITVLPHEDKQENDTMEKTLDNVDIDDVKKKVSDVKVFGNGNLFKLLSKASSEKEGWMKSTKAMETPVGCVVQVTTQQRNHDGTNSIAEALTFVPGVVIASNPEGMFWLDVKTDYHVFIPNAD